MALCIGIGDLHVRTFFRTVEGIDVHVLLRTSFRDGYMTKIFPTGRKFVLWHSTLLATITTKTAINLIYEDIIVLTGRPIPRDDGIHDVKHFCTIAIQTMNRLLPKRQYWSLFKALWSWQLGPTAISWNADVPWPWPWSIGVSLYGGGIPFWVDFAPVFRCTGSLEENLPGKLVHVYIANLSAESENIPKSVKDALASNAPICFVRAQEYEPPKLVVE